MKLGGFSVSLSVQDMATSLGFYRKLGFEQMGGDGESWTILANGTTVIGLFQGMFEGNILTFNPGWDSSAQPLASFADIRQLKERLTSDGIELVQDTTGDNPEGPASFSVVDPDGNAILFDQHV